MTSNRHLEILFVRRVPVIDKKDEFLIFGSGAGGPTPAKDHAKIQPAVDGQTNLAEPENWMS